MAGMVVGTDRDTVLDRAGAVVERLGRGGSPEDLLAAWGDRWIAGTVDQVVGRLREYEDAGVDRVMLQHLVHEDLETVALLGREVAPAVA